MGMKFLSGKKVGLIVAMLVVVFTVMYSVKNQPAPVKDAGQDAADTGSSDQVKHKVLSFNLEGLTDKGAKKWDVKGETAEAISENEVKLDNIVAKAYGDEGEATITADTGVYNKLKNNVVLEQNVKATIDSTNGLAEGFPELSAKKAAGQPEADKPKKAAKTGDKKRTIITCDGDVQFDYEHNVAYFSTNVKVNTPDGDITADKITVHLDMTTRRLKEIVAEGNVKIVRADNVTYSDKATYVEAEKKIILTGRPKIILTQEPGSEGDLLGGITGGASSPAGK